MWVSPRSPMIINKRLLNEAIAKAGCDHALSKAVGINPASVWRAVHDKGTFSSRGLIAIMAYLGRETAGAIFWDSVYELETKHQIGTVGDWISKNRK